MSTRHDPTKPIMLVSDSPAGWFHSVERYLAEGKVVRAVVRTPNESIHSFIERAKAAVAEHGIRTDEP